MFASRLQIARGSMTSLHQVAPHLERVNNPATGRRSKCHLHVFKSRAGAGRRSTRSLYFSKVVDKRLSSERVPHPSARGRAVFISSGAGFVDRSRNPLRCFARSNNIFHSLFYPKCLQVSPRTPMDTPTPDKDLCNAKRKLKCIIHNLNDQNIQE